MQNAWRFVENNTVRDRLREAKGIGMLATRAQTIAGLTQQGFLSAPRECIKLTDRGHALFKVLYRGGFVGPRRDSVA